MAEHDAPAGTGTAAPVAPAADPSSAPSATPARPAGPDDAPDAEGPRTPLAAALRPLRGMLSDDLQYAVYLHPGALETLGETIAPFLTPGPHGPHLVATDIDTAGALAEMTVETTTATGARQRTEVMFPVAMIRIVLSIGGLADGFGFRTRE